MDTELSGTTALVVEDEVDLAELYATWLRLSGSTVQVANSGAEASECLAATETPFDVAVLDRRLGDTTGSDVLEQIRRQTEDTRVIMLTAVTPDVDILPMPFNEYLIKPVSGDDLVGTVAEMLARGRYLDCVDDLYVALRKLTLLQATTSDAELRADPEYCRLTETVDDLRRQADEAFSALDSPAGVLRELA
jgi:DNA-binding response OmpR family regulator